MSDEPEDLFGFMLRQPSGSRGLTALRKLIRRGRDRLAPYFALSLAAHIVFLGVLAVARGTGGGNRCAGPADTHRQAVRQALEAVRLDARESGVLSEALAGLDESGYQYLFDHAPSLDPRLGKREQAEIFKSLMRASLGRLEERSGDASALEEPPWGLLPGPDGRSPLKTAEGDILYPLGSAPDGRPTLFRIAAATAQRLESLRSFEEKRPSRRRSTGGRVEIRTDGGFARVPDEYYFRDCPYEAMIALGGSVFYAISGFPPLVVQDEPAGSSIEAGKPPAQEASPASADLIEIIFLSPEVIDDGPAAKEELAVLPALTEANIPKILDVLMELDDEDQVRVFLERFLVGREPDDPLLAKLTRRFLYENLGGAFNLGSRLTTAFDFLEELYFNKTTQGNLIAYGLENRKSRTGVEILLCLAALYDFERRGLAYLADSLDEIEAVLANRPGRADVFNGSAKAFVLSEVYRDTVAGIRRRGIDAIDPVLREYRDEQERIYRLLIGAGGETECRARYALGCLYWDVGEESRALKEWQAIDPSFETPVLARLRWIMSLTYGKDLLWSRIDAVFQEGSKTSSLDAIERYARFHLWEKRSVRVRAGAGD
ncbi:MAG: hypothetical protein H6P96_541 [Candidatus Aminicenantes bacterium]|jgi:hypothetical protein|nr:hypothetical protein [Candidatus Aminicenantes bacterium]MBP1769923.1 hypothetical protein [Candidatus Aminicenantes bacterium]